MQSAEGAGSQGSQNLGREVQNPKFKVQTEEPIPSEKLCDACSMWFVGLDFEVCLNFGF
jgi:hypothetical protein